MKNNVIKGLTDGIEYERSKFQSLFSLKSKDEGIKAFLNKKKPNFENM